MAKETGLRVQSAPLVHFENQFVPVLFSSIVTVPWPWTGPFGPTNPNTASESVPRQPRCRIAL